METARDREIILLIEILTKRGEEDFNTFSFFIIVFNRGLKIKTRLLYFFSIRSLFIRYICGGIDSRDTTSSLMSQMRDNGNFMSP